MIGKVRYHYFHFLCFLFSITSISKYMISNVFLSYLNCGYIWKSTFSFSMWSYVWVEKVNYARTERAISMHLTWMYIVMRTLFGCIFFLHIRISPPVISLQVLMSSKSVQTVMGLILAFGNYMNGGKNAQISNQYNVGGITWSFLIFYVKLKKRPYRLSLFLICQCAALAVGKGGRSPPPPRLFFCSNPL